jgi:hypothetical protein
MNIQPQGQIPNESIYNLSKIIIIIMNADEDAIFDLRNVYNLTEHVVDWFGLGTQLEITNSRLKKIRLENDTEDGRRREMIFSWLHGDPEASWLKLSKALVRVEHRALADRIDREILPLHTSSKAGIGSIARAGIYKSTIQLIFELATLISFTCVCRLTTEW